MNTCDKHEVNSGLNKLYSVTDFICGFLDAAEKSKLGDIIKSPVISAIFTSAEETLPVINFFFKFLSKITVPQDKDEQCLIICSLAYKHAFCKTLHECADIVINVTKEERAQIQDEIRNYKWEKVLADNFDISCALSTSFIRDADKILAKALDYIGIRHVDKIRFLNQMHINFQKSIIEIFSDKRTQDKFQKLIEFTKNRTDEYTSKLVLKEWAEYQNWLFTSCPLYMEKEFALKDIYVKPKHFDSRKKRNQFLEETVLRQLGNEHFNSFITINGSAGAGKSSFTLSLCSKLVEHGMIPIRIQFKKIKFDTTKKYFDKEEIYSILEKTISFQDNARYGEFYPQIPNNLFCNGKIFNERIHFGKTYISPYVLILDGWDELNNDIQQSMRYFWLGLHETFIKNPNNKIRVILTGRPHRAMEALFADLWAQQLTIKNFNANEMIELLNKLDYFNPMAETYKTNLVQKFRERREFDILKSPLIVYILHELLTDSNKTINIEQLFSNKALLYKTLADITCENAGKKKLDKDGKFDTKLYGNNLRTVLKKTAAVISIKGEELVTHEDLQQILDEEELAITEDEITKALVSYYFKGGNYNAGCEFIHKSFREYFFAELIFDLITQSRQKDDLEASMLKLLSTKSLQDEEVVFLTGLLDNRIQHPFTQDLELTQSIRKNLIDLWSSWTEQHYIRYKNNDDSISLPITQALNNILKLLKSNYTPEYLNSILGANLLLLNVIFNKIFLRKCGIHSLKNIEIKQKQNFVIKFKLPNSNMTFSAFEPFGKRSLTIEYMTNLIQSLHNGSDMWLEFDLCYFDSLVMDSLSIPDTCFRDCYFTSVTFRCLALNQAEFYNSYLKDCVFLNSNLGALEFKNCIIENTVFKQTDLSGSNFIRTTVCNAEFQNIDAGEMSIKECELKSAKFETANLMDAKIENSKLTDTTFTNSNLFKLKILSKSVLENLKFECTDLKAAEFHDTHLTNIIFNYCKLHKIMFAVVALRQVLFKCCSLINSTFRGDFYKEISFDNTELKNNCITEESSMQMQLSPEISKNFNIISQKKKPF